MDYKLYEVQLPGWANPIRLRAPDMADAIALSRLLWKIPTDKAITACEVVGE